MKKVIYPFFLVVICLACTSAKAQRIIQSFDKDWRFYKGDVAGAEEANYNDQSWRKLDVPHDWSIEGPYDVKNSTGRGGGYLPAGIGWYRKSFILDNSYKNKKVSIEFDGVMANSDVWINGNHLGKRPYGYISFSYELSGHLRYGSNNPNILVVKADNSIQPASRYYTGAGIYRHVRLVATDPVHFDHWEVVITTPTASQQSAVINIRSKVDNESTTTKEYTIVNDIVDATGKLITSATTKQRIAGGKTSEILQEIQLQSPKLWDFDHPLLYKSISKVLDGNKILDEQATPFGIRTIKFDAATGFWVNNKNVKLKGVCLHHDAGAFGSAVPLSVWQRRLSSLKQIGVNAIRTSHNPVAPEFLDLCDQMGFVVMDESFDTWTAPKPPGDKGYNLYFNDWWQRDTHDMIVRDRNHPSIVIYSVGNEIHDNLNSPEGFKKYKDQQDLIHQLDGTRPVTMALLRPGSSKVYTSGFAEMMDVVGQNYRENELVAAHEQHPGWKVIGTENTHVLSAWLVLRDKPFVAGQFLWTGYDYLGEATWPLIANGSGLYNRIGELKPIGMQRESWWSDKPVVHIVRVEPAQRNRGLIADWNPASASTNDSAHVQVFSNCNEVELFLNGKSLGTKSIPADDASRNWNLLYQKGTIKAVGKNNGKTVAQEEYSTSGTPAKIILSTDRKSIGNNWDDVAFITATIVDAAGNICTNEDRKIKFNIEGSGFIDGVDNGSLANHENYKSTEMTSYRGRCTAFVKGNSAGKALISANVEGVGNSKPLTITIK
jgi:beta-galactosidase